MGRFGETSLPVRYSFRRSGHSTLSLDPNFFPFRLRRTHCSCAPRTDPHKRQTCLPLSLLRILSYACIARRENPIACLAVGKSRRAAPLLCLTAVSPDVSKLKSIARNNARNSFLNSRAEKFTMETSDAIRWTRRSRLSLSPRFAPSHADSASQVYDRWRS